MYRTIRALCLGTMIGLLGVLVAWSPIGADIEEAAGLFLLFNTRGPADYPDETVIVSLDRASAQRLKLPTDPRYWPRAGRAELIDRLSNIGASAIALDTFLERETDPENDAALGSAISRSGRVALLTRLVPANMLDRAGSSGIAAHALSAVGLIDPIPEFSGARVVAPFPLPKDGNRLNRVWVFISDLGDIPTLPAVTLQIHLMPAMDEWRRVLAEAGIPAEALPPPADQLVDPQAVLRSMQKLRRIFLQDVSLEERLAEVITAHVGHWGSATQKSIKALLRLYSGPDSRLLNFYGPYSQITIFSYADILAPTGKVVISDLSGKAVFVGNADPSPAYNSDMHRTVFSTANAPDISGVEVGATAFLNLLQDSDLRKPDMFDQAAILLVLGMMFGVLAYSISIPFSFILNALIGCAYFGGAFILFTRFNLVVPVTVPLLLQLPVAQLSGLIWQQSNIKRNLHSYLPAHVADTLGTAPVDIHLIDKLTYGVCLATDVQNYTTLSESISPNTLAALTNDYFNILFEPVKRRNGMVTGIAGDGVMSVWTSPTPNATIRGQAALAALDLVKRLDEFNERIAPLAMPTRFGLSAGWIAVGNVGGAGHFAFSAVGDIPNTASRAENLNKHLGTRILATEEVVIGMRHLLLRRIGKFLLVGKIDPVSIYEILCPLSTSSQLDRLRCEAYDEALSVFEKGDWARAEQLFLSLAAKFPKDGPARYMARAARERLSSTMKSADPIIRLTKK